MNLVGNIRKMTSYLDDEVIYNLPLFNVIKSNHQIQLNQLIDQTTIEIEIIHPKIEKSIKCKGKITQLILN